MPFISDKLEQYIEENSSREPLYLSELRREAYIHLLQPRMLSGHLQGRLLKMLVALFRPRNILELGTYSGYSTLCLAEGLEATAPSPQAKVYTIEVCDEMEDFIRNNFAKSAYGKRIELLIGHAEELIPSLLKEVLFDFVYIDANKRHYLHYYHLLIEALPPGALILADNTLWDGKVIEVPTPTDSQTQGILSFNQTVAQDPRVETVLLPLRDGLTLMRKVE